MVYSPVVSLLVFCLCRSNDSIDVSCLKFYKILGRAGAMNSCLSARPYVSMSVISFSRNLFISFLENFAWW